MKICRKHKEEFLRDNEDNPDAMALIGLSMAMSRGKTFEIVSEEECEICKKE